MKKGIVLFVEGETEEEFYQKCKEIIKNKCCNKIFKPDVVKICNLNGIGNFKVRCLRKFKNEVLKNYPETIFHIFLCYDVDVFEFNEKPPVNMKEVEHDLKNIGANKVTHIKAKLSIEEWFLKDMDNIIKYLKLPKNTKFNPEKDLNN